MGDPGVDEQNAHVLKYKIVKKQFLLGFLSYLLSFTAVAQPELRGVWIAWGGANPPRKTDIARMMDNLAQHNVNTVYVDVWRYGWPYFRSQLFYDLTGQWSDPLLEPGRDVLADMIAEGHRVGLHVEAWFEYGFAACHNNNDDLYRARPQWFAQHRNGSVLFNGDYRWKWLSHVHPEAQQFLIDLCQEVVARYDVDGIELDRIRYPELDCGYDPATVAVYQSEHNGAAPPQSPSDAGWMRWRADKLTEFVTAFYDSIKAINPDVFVSNAPIPYSWGYDHFCQDWRPWINNGVLDFISTQLYWPTNAVYASDLERHLTYISDRSKFYPGICAIANNIIVPGAEIAAMIQTTRARNLRGHVIWFYDQLVDDLPYLKQTVYQEKVAVPDRPPTWRQPAIIVHEEDAAVSRSQGWTFYGGIPGYDGGCLYAKAGADCWLEYRADIPEPGWYELYVFNIFQYKASKLAPYAVRHALGVDTVRVNQAVSGQARWFKLGDYYLRSGAAQPVVRLSNAGIESDTFLFADAIMLVRSRRPLGIPSGLTTAAREQAESAVSLTSYPNPFNSAANIRYHLPQNGRVQLRVFDGAGRQVALLLDGICPAGPGVVIWNALQQPSGVYFVKLVMDGMVETHKLVVIK